MSRAALTLDSAARREQALSWVRFAPLGTHVEFREAKRSNAQNRKLWDLLTIVAGQVEWHGQKLAADDWKLIFMAALNREARLVPNLDGTGFVDLGQSSSKLSKAEMSDLIELINCFCAQRGVVMRRGD